MALALRLRRAAAALSSAANKDRLVSSLTPSSFAAAPLTSLPHAAAFLGNPSFCPHTFVHSHSFRSSATSLDRARSNFGGENREIGPDEILFEGCDYNHWLITMDFPKDPKPTPEEMVETYVQTLAKVVGSVEEAKKRMYACSTTTYNGFQAVMTEEMSEKFKGLPGVVFILPDSYIDPVNKQYGGDKYDNGVITHRPPPIQYEPRRGRYNDQNRRYNQPRYDGQRDPMPTQQGNMPRDQQAQGDGRSYAPQQSYSPPRQDGRSYAPQQNYGPPRQDGRSNAPQQNYGPPGQDGRNYSPQQNYGPPGQDGRNYSPQQNYGPPGQDGRSYSPQQNYSPPGQDGRGFGPPGGRNFGQEERRDNAGGGIDGYQGEHRNLMPNYQRDFNQGQQGNYAPQEHRNFEQGQVTGPTHEQNSPGPVEGQNQSWQQGRF